VKSENEIKFANVSRDINLFGKKCYFVEVCSPVYASFWAHDDIRIPYDFKFYVGLPHPTSADVFSLFVMFFCENYSVFITKSVHLHCQINFNIATIMTLYLVPVKHCVIYSMFLTLSRTLPTDPKR